MEVLKDYPKQFAKIFQTSFNLLFQINMKFWFNDESFMRRYWRFLYICPIIAVFITTVFIDVAKILVEGKITAIAYRVPPFLVIIQAILKILIIFPKSALITAIIKELGNVWKTTGLSKKQIKIRNTFVKRLKLCTTGIYWIAIIGTSHYLMSPIFETLLYKFILQQQTELLLPIASSFPFDPTEDWLVYIAVYVFQTYSMFLCVLAYVGSELIMITLSGLLGIEFKLLCEDMLRVKPVTKRNRSQDEVENLFPEDVATYTIEDLVKKHQKLILLSTQIDIVFNKMIFIDLLFAGGTACFFRYAAQFSRGPTYMINSYVAVVTSLLYVLLLCYYGELLTSAELPRHTFRTIFFFILLMTKMFKNVQDQIENRKNRTEMSLRIGDAVYGSLWYRGDERYQRNIVLIIKRSQSVCCLTSMNYAPVTLNMFTKVISTTWSYFSLMNSIYQEVQ